RAQDVGPEPGAVRRPPGVPVPRRAAVRLRGLRGDGADVPGAARRGRHPRRGADPARALRHAPGRHAGTRLVRRRARGLSPVDDSAADPVAWVMIEPGWEVVDSAGEGAGKVFEVT